MLYPLKLQDSTVGKNLIWFDEDGLSWWGEDENNLQSAEGVELSSGYKIPKHIYITDLSNAFKLGLEVGLRINRLSEKISALKDELNGDQF